MHYSLLFERTGLMVLTLVLVSACETGPPLPPRATTQNCRPFRDGAPVATLAATGCFAPVTGLVPSDDLVEYAVRSALFTDGASKQRFVSLPPDTQLQLVDDALEFPDRTTLVKIFSLNIVEPAGARTRALEVRFLVRDSGAWEMFSYRLDPDEADGMLIEDFALVDMTTETDAGPVDVSYLFPDEAACRTCHGSSRPVLGFEISQLNHRYNYGPSTENQLLALQDIGLIEGAPPAIEGLPRLADPNEESETREARARSWLHANCGHCHRPGGFGATTGMYLSAELDFVDTSTCGVGTNFYGGVLSRIEPGFPDDSGIVRRIREEDVFRMPPLGVSILDQTGEALLVDWITNLAGCPE